MHLCKPAAMSNEKCVVETHDESVNDFVFEFVTKIPNLELKRGCVEQLEIHLNDQCTRITELEKNVRGFLLSRADEMYLGTQGFTLPRVGTVKWKKLNIPNDSPTNNILDINEMMDAIMLKLVPLERAIT